MTSRRTLWVAVVLVAGSSLGAWGALGTFTLASAEATSPRVAMLPPISVLLVLLVAIAALGVALWRTGRGLWPLAPACLALVPWLPVPLPAAVLAWAGPWTAVLWTVSIAGLVNAGTGAAAERVFRGRWLDGRRAPWVAGLVAFLIYVAAGARVAPVLPGGDEPHYLIITQSLLLDGDLRIENNHLRGDYRSYASGTLRPDYLRRGMDREIYSIHLPGASVLVLPAFAAGGYPLVKVWLALLAALGSAVAWRVARGVVDSPGAAWFAWAATALTAPFLFLAFTVYPDGPGALAVMLGLAAIVGLERQGSRPPAWWVAASLAPALLPWLHPRFALVAGCFGLVFVARAWHSPQRVRALLAFVAMPVVSALGWFGYYLSIYGSPNPSIAYGHYTQMAVANAWRGLIGLAFDQQFGLAGTAPVYLLVAVGLWSLWRRRRRLAIEWLVVVVPYVFVSAMYHMWWGGHSSPARFLGSVMLACAIPLAAAWHAGARASTRTLQLSLLGVSLLLAATLTWVDAGRIVFNTRDGFALWASWASRTVDLARALPSVFRTTPTTALTVAATWIALLALAWVVPAVREARGRLARSMAAALTATGLAVASAGAMTVAWGLDGASGLAPATGQVAFLNRLASGPDRPRAAVAPFSLRTGRAVSSSAVTIDGAGLPGRPAWAALWVPRLPAGRYRVTFANRIPGTSAAFDVVVGRGEEAVDRWLMHDVPRGTVQREIVLPWAVRSLALRASEPARRAFSRVSLVAVELGPAPTAGRDLVTAARRYGDTVVSSVGDTAYLEGPGVWTAGDRGGQLVLQPPATRREQEVFVRAGAVATQVDVSLAGWRAQLTLQAGEGRTLSVPLPADRAAVVLTVTATPGFRPSETEPGNADSRRLGAWLEFR